MTRCEVSTGCPFDLNALHNLEIEARERHDATASAQQSLDLFDTRYEGGVDANLQVINWQTALLVNERNDIEITRCRYESSVLLVKALGGGWDKSQLHNNPEDVSSLQEHQPVA